MIEIKHYSEDSGIVRATLVLEGMSICLETMPLKSGGRSLSVRVPNAVTVGLAHHSNMENWIISKEGMAHNVAGATITSSGSAKDAT